MLGFFMAACGSGVGGLSGSGTLQTSLTDSATVEYKAVYVTIARVEVHISGGQWQVVAEPGKTYNLLELVNGVRETLGMDTLDAGHYTQMRLIIGTTPDTGLNIQSATHPYANYAIDLADVVHELKVPSGTQTGLKIVKNFDISPGQTTELILDFDAMRSVVKAGASGQYILKPTVKVLDTSEYSIASGAVTDGAALEGAFVSAQSVDPLATDAADRVVIEAGTVTDSSGNYALFLEPMAYNLVAVRDGYLPVCSSVTLLSGGTATVDFVLTPDAAAPGTVTGGVTIELTPGEQWATIEFRRDADCGGGGATPVIVATLNVADGGTYSVDLPDGSYTLVASSYGKATQSAPVSVTSSVVTTQDVLFP